MPEKDQIVPLTEDEQERLSDLSKKLSEWDDKDTSELPPEEQDEIQALTDEYNELAGKHQAWQDGQKAQEPSDEEKALEEMRQRERTYLEEHGLGDYDSIEEALADLPNLKDQLGSIGKLESIAKTAGYQSLDQLVQSAMQKRVDRGTIQPRKKIDLGGSEDLKNLQNGMSYTVLRQRNIEWKLFKKDHPEVKEKDRKAIEELGYGKFWDMGDPLEEAFVHLEAKKGLGKRSASSSQKALDEEFKKKLISQTRIPTTVKPKPKLSEKQREMREVYGIGDPNKPFID